MREKLIELLSTDVECDHADLGNCFICEYKYAGDKCLRYMSGLMADYLLANNVIIQREAEWEIVIGSNGREKMVCTDCRHQQDLASTFTYCPNCGARMKGVKR